MAVPLFIFAATVCRFVEDEGRSNPAKRLKYVLQYRTETHDSKPNKLDKLDMTYLPVLNRLTFGRTDEDKADVLAEFRDVVGPIVLLAQPLSVQSLAGLLQIEPEDVHGQLNSLHSVLSVPSKADAPVRLFHLSFRDFLVDPTKRAREFWIDEIKYHKTLTDRCIQLMHQHLKRDICGLQMPGKRRSEVNQQTIDAALPPEIQYACRYWVYHWKESKCLIRDGDFVDCFLTRHLLHWLEALSLLGWVSESIGMVDDLLGLLDVRAVFSILLDDILTCFSIARRKRQGLGVSFGYQASHSKSLLCYRYIASSGLPFGYHICANAERRPKDVPGSISRLACSTAKS